MSTSFIPKLVLNISAIIGNAKVNQTGMDVFEMLNDSPLYDYSEYFLKIFIKIKFIFFGIGIGITSIILNSTKCYVLIRSGLRRKTDAGLLISTLADIITASVEISWLICMYLDEKPIIFDKFIPITDELRNSSAWITVLLATQRYYSITDNQTNQLMWVYVHWK